MFCKSEGITLHPNARLSIAEREKMHADMVGTYLSHPEAFPVLEVLALTCCELLEGPSAAEFAGLPQLADQTTCFDCCLRPQTVLKSRFWSCLLIKSS